MFPAYIICTWRVRLPQEGIEILRKEIGAAYPDYAVRIVPDVDVSD